MTLISLIPICLSEISQYVISDEQLFLLVCQMPLLHLRHLRFQALNQLYSLRFSKDLKEFLYINKVQTSCRFIKNIESIACGFLA